MKPRAVIGIDPGKGKSSPGAAVLLTNHFSIEVYDYEDDYTAGIWARAMLKQYDIRRVFIEQLNADPYWPPKTNFSLGGSYHGWKQMWAFAQIPITVVRPIKWQKGLFSMEDRKQGKDPKQKSVFYVRREYPGFAPTLAKHLKDHGRCDAFLIARWGKQQQDE